MVDIEIRDELEISRIGDRPIYATLYRPQVATDLPCIIWIHGGGWYAGDRFESVDLCREVARQGFACLSIDYRLSGETIFPAAIHDCKAAVRYARAHAQQLGILPEKIGAWGTSAGAHLAALLGASASVLELEGTGGWPDYSSAVQAVCDWFGPTDFLRMSAFPSDFDHDAPDSPESMFIGMPIQQHPAETQRANPVTYVSSTTPPMLIAHGTADPLVPFNQSELLHDALAAHGVEVVFERLEGADHGGPGFEADSPLFGKCIDFFKSHLQGN